MKARDYEEREHLVDYQQLAQAHDKMLFKDGTYYAPGEVITAKDGRKYIVDKNGCWRSLEKYTAEGTLEDGE